MEVSEDVMYGNFPYITSSDTSTSCTFQPRKFNVPVNGFLARDVIHTSRAYATMSVRLSVTEVHWRIVANLGFKFRSKFTAHCGRGACGREGRDHLALC